MDRGLMMVLPSSDFSDEPKEACGIVGIYAPGRDVARLTFFALYALQHRGQESAGITTSDGHRAHIHKGMGLVSQVFNEENLSTLEGYLAIGHNRYSTTGTSKLRNAQPYLIETYLGPLGVAHNGNLVNAPHLRRDLLERGTGLTSSSDSEVITQILAGGMGNWENRIQRLLEQAVGAYALTILTREAVYGVRDPWGFRPLVLGQFDSGGYVLASESCALTTIGATYIRDVEPGELVRLDANGVYSEHVAAPKPPMAMCTFEHIYFARPDSLFANTTVHALRQALGRQLAIEAPADADCVVAVPDSGTPAGIGYAQQIGLPFTEGLIKNRYIGRTFIQPTDTLRKTAIGLKFNPLPGNLEGKRVIMVDDSIVRGNTSGPLVRLLRESGATEVHVRVSSPPIKHPCYMGIDMATSDELIANIMTIEQIREHIGADSLAYISLEGLMSVVGTPNHRYCNACFTGVYPIKIFDDEQDKLQFEGAFGS
jgi:amidophosphoribosyltransferase